MNEIGVHSHVCESLGLASYSVNMHHSSLTLIRSVLQMSHLMFTITSSSLIAISEVVIINGFACFYHLEPVLPESVPELSQPTLHVTKNPSCCEGQQQILRCLGSWIIAFEARIRYALIHSYAMGNERSQDHRDNDGSCRSSANMSTLQWAQSSNFYVLLPVRYASTRPLTLQKQKPYFMESRMPFKKCVDSGRDLFLTFLENAQLTIFQHFFNFEHFVLFDSL